MDILTVITIGCYLATGFIQTMRFVGRLPLAKRNLLLLHALTISLHGYLLYQWIDTQHGQNLSTSNMFSFTTWLAGFFLLFSAIKKPVDNLFMFIPPIAAFSILWVIGCPLPNTIHADMTPTNLWHIFIALSAISLLGLAGLQAILVGFQNYALKTTRYTRFVRLFPPLETMEHLLFQIITIGFLLLSIALFTGLWMLRDVLSSMNLEKIVLSIAAWLLFAILLLGHYLAGWRGPMAIRWTLLGSLLLTIAYFGCKLAVEFA